MNRYRQAIELLNCCGLRHKLKSLKTLLMPYKYSFIVGHSYHTDGQVVQIKKILESSEPQSAKADFEKRFSALIGDGYGQSFAAGRMAFYVLMQALGLGIGHEVVLPGFTCSVMVNAVLRLGATPIFADIDPETFGSSAQEIGKKITDKTRMIVAQHSFGIPSQIDDIVELGKRVGVFVVEDCALTLDSSLKGRKLGDWGGAAIFSTEHSKPINTMIGGILYTKDKSLYNKIREISAAMPDLENGHQARIYAQYLFERRYYLPTRYWRSFFVNITRVILKKIRQGYEKAIYLGDDYANKFLGPKNYPYPAKLPLFLAKIGLFELDRWSNEKARRKLMLEQYLRIMGGSKMASYIPKAYKDVDSEIVPLRFAFTHPDAGKIKSLMAKYLDTNQILFTAPIVCCPDGPESLGYHYGDCPIAEKVCSEIVNWPCIMPEEYQADMLDRFQEIVNS
jgi:dTDP-4-amino-4,6-dideoxygalactose transaminase